MESSVCGEPSDQKTQFRALLDNAYPNGFAGDQLELLMSIMFGRMARAKAAARAMLDHWRCFYKPRSAVLTRFVWIDNM